MEFCEKGKFILIDLTQRQDFKNLNLLVNTNTETLLIKNVVQNGRYIFLCI